MLPMTQPDMSGASGWRADLGSEGAVLEFRRAGLDALRLSHDASERRRLMLLGAFACAHTPQLLIRPPTEDRALVLSVHAAFTQVRERLAALRPDAIVVIAGDHIEAFFLDAVPALAVYVGAECAGTFGPYDYRFTIHEPLARTVVEQG